MGQTSQRENRRRSRKNEGSRNKQHSKHTGGRDQNPPNPRGTKCPESVSSFRLCSIAGVCGAGVQGWKLAPIRMGVAIVFCRPGVTHPNPWHTSWPECETERRGRERQVDGNTQVLAGPWVQQTAAFQVFRPSIRFSSGSNKARTQDSYVKSLHFKIWATLLVYAMLAVITRKPPGLCGIS